MTQGELKALIEDLRLNHEFCPKEIILQAADELERMQQGIETLHAMYEQVGRQTQHLMTLVERVVAEEREACAKLCDRYTDSCSDHEAGTAMNIQEAIRARGKP